MDNPRIELTKRPKISMAGLEQVIREWGETETGLLSFKVARTLNRECRVALDVENEAARTIVHRSFCVLEAELLPRIEFDLEWMTFSVDEYPLQRRAFFDGCRQHPAADMAETLVPSVFVVFEQRFNPTLRKRWFHLVYDV